ncbi:MAG: Hpt domain-containing protein [Candidatus Omnitrophica bacterium]|nr:Hpt domain-containing protein [Candidatus Omnitrophota bacterium]
MEFDKKKAMDEMGEDEESYNELLRIFCPDAEIELKKLEEALKADNFDEIVRIGHTLKGLAANFYVTPVQVIAKNIEHLARVRRDKQAIVGNLQILKEGMAELRRQI